MSLFPPRFPSVFVLGWASILLTTWLTLSHWILLACIVVFLVFHVLDLRKRLAAMNEVSAVKLMVSTVLFIQLSLCLLALGLFRIFDAEPLRIAGAIVAWLVLWVGTVFAVTLVFAPTDRGLKRSDWFMERG